MAKGKSKGKKKGKGSDTALKEGDDSSSDSGDEKAVKKKAEPVPEEKPVKEKGKKGKKNEEPEVDPGPGPGVEGVGEIAMAEIIRFREEAEAARLKRLEALGLLVPEPKKKRKPKPKKEKKVKMTKELMEQMKKEAEEEAARIIEMERLRIEEEKRVALEKERRETAEQMVRSEQLEKSRILYSEITKFNKKIDKKEKSVVDWNLYVACGELPNASICPHMSTYLHLWEKIIEETKIEDASTRTYDVMKAYKIFFIKLLQL